MQLNGETIMIPFPRKGVLYKGGVARIMAKLFTDSSLDGETSRSDIDIIVKKGERPIEEILKDYRASITDTEIVDEIDEGRILATRDIDMNSVLVSENSLLLTEAARKACQTRIIHPLLPKERELFGRSTFRIGDIDLTRSVLLYRLVRTVVDNKADAFEIKRAETKVPLGIYWLILARNYLKRADRVQKIERLYEIAKEMNQAEEAQNPIEWLEKLHQKYPDFDFESSGLSKQEYARWMFGKFLKLVAQKYKHASKFYQQDFMIENPDTALQLVR